MSVSLKRLAALPALRSDCVSFNLCSFCSFLTPQFPVLILPSFLVSVTSSPASPCCHLSISFRAILSFSLFECFHSLSLGSVWRPEARSHTAAILKRTKEGPAAALYPKALSYAHTLIHTHTHSSRGANTSPADKP